MKRSIKLIAAAFVFIFFALQAIQPFKVHASELADGKYTISYNVLYNGESSSWGSYFSNPATLIVDDGKKYISFTLGASNVVTNFQVKLNDTFQDVQVLSEDTANKKRTIQFEVESLDEATIANMVMSYGMTHQIQLQFDKNSIAIVELEPVAEENPTEEQQEETEQESPEQEDTTEGTTQENTEQENTQPEETQEEPSFADGAYNVSYQILYEGQPSQASWVSYFSNPASMTVEDGKKYITLTVGASNVITNFQTELNGAFQNAEVLSENSETKTRVYKFEVSGFLEPTSATMTMSYGGVHTIQLAFDSNSVAKQATTIPEDTSDESNNDSTTNDETENNEENTDNNAAIQDGEYDLPLNVLAVDSDTASAFEKYFETEAILKVQNGKQQLLLTQIKGLTTIGNIEFQVADSTVALTEVSRNETEGTRVLSLDLSAIESSYTASIEAIGAPHLYPVRFVLDLSSLGITEAEEGTEDQDDTTQEEEASTNTDSSTDSGSTTSSEDTSSTSFDRNADSVSQTSTTATTSENVTNAKTGDTLNTFEICLYAFLLLGSGWYLTRRYVWS